MSSRQKRLQARRNGAKAAGSKSPAGIQKSSLNAVKHGLTSKAIVLSNESQAIFDDLHLDYVKEFLPQSTVEMDLVDQMVAAQWRLRRIWRMQTSALDLKMDQQEKEIANTYQQIDQATRTTIALSTLANEEHSLDLLLRYETAYTRMHQRAMNSLYKLRVQKLKIAELRNDAEPHPEPCDLQLSAPAKEPTQLTQQPKEQPEVRKIDSEPVEASTATRKPAPEITHEPAR